MSDSVRQIIGLGHYSGVGKDTLAEYIMGACEGRQLRVTRIGFADTLKSHCRDLYRWAGLQHASYYEKNREARYVPLEALGLTPVDIWVQVGNKLREVYEDTWVDIVFNYIHSFPADVVIIPDVRYENEALRIKAHGGKLIKVVRPGVRPRDTESDVAMVGWQEWDYVVGGTLTDLLLHAQQIANSCHTNAWPLQPEAERQHHLAMEQVDVS